MAVRPCMHEERTMKFLDQQLRYFTKIAELKSLTSAAEALDISQSALSKQLHQLEEYLGQSLFHRHGRGVSLTSAGEKLFAVTLSSFGALDHAVSQLKTVEGVTEGAVRIATVHTLSSYFIPGLLGAFLGQRPHSNVSLLNRSSPEVVALLEAGKVDVGFVYDVMVASGNLNILNLFSEEMVLICHRELCPQDGPIDLLQTSLPLICFPPHYALRRMLEYAKIDRNVVAEVETVDAMLKLVNGKLGCCVLPERIPKDFVEERGLLRIPIASPTLRRAVVAVTRKDKPVSPLIDLLLTIARQQADL